MCEADSKKSNLLGVATAPRSLFSPKMIVFYSTIIALAVLIDVQYPFGYAGAGLGGLILFSIPAIIVVAVVVGLSKMKRLCLIFILTGISILVGHIAGMQINAAKTRNTFKKAEAIIIALDKYRDSHGKYPEGLSDLAPAHLSILPCSSLRLWAHPSFGYTTNVSRDHFELGFILPAFMKSEYSSQTGSWVTHD